MKNTFFSFIFAVLFSIIPLEVFVSAASFVRLGDAYLDENNPYLENGVPVSYCDLGVNGCDAYLETTGLNAVNLHLNYYDGDEIEIEGIDNVNIEVKDQAWIHARGEVGIKTDANLLSFTPTDPNTSTTLSVSVGDYTNNSAVGILNTRGSIDLGSRMWYSISLYSAHPYDVESTNDVTGIVTRSDQNISMALDAHIDIYNPTGDYGIYTGHIYSRDESISGSACSHETIMRIINKTNLTQQAIYQNDFNGPSLTTEIVNIPKTLYTSILGWEYRITPLFDQSIAVNFDDELEYGENASTANDRIINSADIEYNPSDYSDNKVLQGYSPMYGLGIWGSSSLVALDDDALSGYHDISDDTISNENYALKLAIDLWETEWFAFGEIQSPKIRFMINHEEVEAQLHYVNAGQVYLLLPLTVKNAPVLGTANSITNNDDEQDSTDNGTDTTGTEDDSDDNIVAGVTTPLTAYVFPKITLPKAPNTGRK